MANGIDNKAQAARTQIGFDSSDPLRPELEHLQISTPSASGSNVASGPAFASRLEVEGKPLAGSFNTRFDTYGRPYDGMARLDGAHLRVRQNATRTFADFKMRAAYDASSGITQRIEYAVSTADAPGAATFQQAFDATLPETIRARYEQAIAAGVAATAVRPTTFDAIHMVDAASAKRAAARLGALADSADAAQKVLGEGWTITRTSSAKIGMSGSGPIPGGDAPGYESTWAFSVAGPSGVRFGVQMSVAERRFAGQAEASGEIRTSTIEGGRLFTLAEKLIRYSSAK